MLLLALLLFTLGNSTDAFLLLRLSGAGVPAAWVAGLWSAHHVVKMASTYVGGRLSDRLGRRRMVLAGWAVYAAIHLAFALVQTPAELIAIFLAYGLYFGLTEPAEKAWIAGDAGNALRGGCRVVFGWQGAVVVGWFLRRSPLLAPKLGLSGSFIVKFKKGGQMEHLF